MGTMSLPSSGYCNHAIIELEIELYGPHPLSGGAQV